MIEFDRIWIKIANELYLYPSEVNNLLSIMNLSPYQPLLALQVPEIIFMSKASLLNFEELVDLKRWCKEGGWKWWKKSFSSKTCQFADSFCWAQVPHGTFAGCSRSTLRKTPEASFIFYLLLSFFTFTFFYHFLTPSTFNYLFLVYSCFTFTFLQHAFNLSHSDHAVFFSIKSLFYSLKWIFGL